MEWKQGVIKETNQPVEILSIDEGMLLVNSAFTNLSRVGDTMIWNKSDQIVHYNLAGFEHHFKFTLKADEEEFYGKLKQCS